MSFRIGQEVVCVDDVFDTSMGNFFECFHELPKKNKTYTVRLSESGRVLLEEINNPESPFNIDGITVWDEAGFNEIRFKDLQQALRELSGEVEESEPEVKEFAPQIEELETILYE